MKNSLCSFLMVMSLGSLTAQNFQWGLSYGGSNSESGLSIDVDANKSVIVGGKFKSTVDFDPGPGTVSLSAGINEDGFIQKLDSSGQLLWVYKVGASSGNDDVSSVSVDAVGNVYAAGRYSGSVDLDPGAGIYNTPSGTNGTFIVKFNSIGTFLWAGYFSSAYIGDGDRQLAIDTSGNVYLAGGFLGTVDFDPDTTITYNISSSGSTDAFVLKLDSTGNFHWARTFGSAGTQVSSGIVLDGLGQPVTTGYFESTVDFDPGFSSFNLTSAGSYDVFLQKMDTSGNFLWAIKYGGAGYDYCRSLKINSSDHIVSTGEFEGTVDFNPGTGTSNLVSAGNNDIYVQQLDSLGNFLWAKRMGSSSLDKGVSVDTDNSNNVYLTGWFIGTVDFNPGTSIYNLTSAGTFDNFILKLDSNGIFVWAHRFGTVNADGGYSIKTDSNSFIYSTGAFGPGTIDLDPTAGTSYQTNTSSLYSDVFVLKWGQCQPSFANFATTACDSYFSPSGKYTWTTSGTYPDTIQNSMGCDSVLTINLSINNSTASSYSATACNSYISPSGLFTWTSSGTYNDTITNNAGCDSVITVNLTINQTSYSSITPTACYSYTSPSGQYTWTSSGTYTDTIVNSVGCDSIITVNLTIYNSTYSTISAAGCESYTSPSGTYNWTVSGTYTDTISNSFGCDSIITINLSLNNSFSTINVNACASYSSPSGLYVWSSSGVYSDTITNSSGCDSIITINLSINNSYNTISPSVCSSYLSPSGNYTWNSSGVYTDTLINSLGCDSVITINLSVNNTSSNLTVSSCFTYTSPSGLYTWTTSGSYYDTIVNSLGCDSLININLTIKTVDTSVTVSGISLSANASNATYQWGNCDAGFTVINGATGSSYLPSANGNYAVLITQSGCTDTSSCYSITGVNIVEYSFETINLYPNPSNGKIWIETNRPLKMGEIDVYNSNGQLIQQTKINNQQKFEIDFGGSPGLYFILITDENNFQSKLKVIKSH